jgi:hypothetical protein
VVIKRLLLLLLFIFAFFIVNNVRISRVNFRQDKLYSLKLFHRYFLIRKEKVVFASPIDWKVKEVIWADFNEDTNLDLGLVVWKKGSYGTSRPFWVEGGDDAYSDHLYIYKIEESLFKPLWHSSALERPICRISLDKNNSDSGSKYLIWEGEYKNGGYSCNNTKKTYWQWNGWGFSRLE